MKQQTHQKFLAFNGKKILFLSVDGTYWIALRPICEALGVDYIRCFKNAKNDPILGPALSKQTIQVSKNGNFQGRNMTCIPEEFVYGWIFSLRSDSEELTEYKRTCYRLLYNHFHGTITSRKEMLLERKLYEQEIAEIKSKLKSQAEEEYKRLEELERKRKQTSSKLNTFDKVLISQTELFNKPKTPQQ